MTKIILLDSNSLVNRAFYAIPPMNNSDGVFTNAVYGYLSMLARLITEHRPTHIGAVFDMRAPTFRHKMYDAYKGTRKPMPDELAMQMPILRELLSELNIKLLQLEGYEADDIIGTLAKRFDLPTAIVSGDRDVLQLVDDSTEVFNTKRGVSDIKRYDLQALSEENFTPAKIIEYKALAGDSSDNIPGATGVGDKTAVSLLDTYGNVDEIYAHIEEIKGKLKDKLIASKEQVYLSKTLATINTNVPIDCTLDDLAFEAEPTSRFYEHLAELDCKSLIERFRKLSSAPLQAADILPPEKEEKAEVKAAERIKIETIEQLNGVLKTAQNGIAVDFDITVRFAVEGDKEYYFEPSETLFAGGIDYEEAITCFKDIFNSGVRKLAFDVKALMHRLAAYGIEVKPPYDDVLLKAYLLDANNTPKNLNELGEKYACAATPVAGMFGIDAKESEALGKLKLSELYNDIELPLIKILFDMETAGFNVDIDVLNELSVQYTKTIGELQKAIFMECGGDFNINSPQQLASVLFDKLGLQPSKKTKGKTNYSVSADVLEELDHPVIPLITAYKRLTKLQSTYINGMRTVLDKSSGKVHTVFKQCVTNTGRLSSTEPNLQNIPIRTDEGRLIRKMFVPSEGNLLVSADYSQIELRLLAHFSKDEALLEAYNSGQDIHTLTASKIFNTPFDEVTKAQRRDAKAVNFGIIYGISAYGLAQNTGISRYSAKEFVDRYFATYPKVKSYMDSNVEFAKKNGYIRTLAGRLRFFPELVSANRNIRSFGERAAMNMPLQGSASDIIKIAMIKVAKALEEGGYKAKLILQVHDELVIDTPSDEVDAVKALLVENMQSAVKLNVPLIAEAKVGKNWYSVD